MRRKGASVELVSGAAQSLRQRLHVDVSEDDVVEDVDPVDLVELSDPVPELKERDVVHRHPEGLGRAEDLHLEGDRASASGSPPVRAASLIKEHFFK